MANTLLPNDQILTASIHVNDSAGGMEPAPVGDVFTVVSSHPASLNAVLGVDAAGGPAVMMNALVQTGTGYTVTVSDAAGLTSWTGTFDIVADTTPVAIMVDLVDATHTSQPVPTAVGP